MRPDGSGQEQLTFDDFNNWFPHVSPNGRTIVFITYGPDVRADDHPWYKAGLRPQDAARRRQADGSGLRLRRPGFTERQLLGARQQEHRVCEQYRRVLESRWRFGILTSPLSSLAVRTRPGDAGRGRFEASRSEHPESKLEARRRRGCPRSLDACRRTDNGQRRFPLRDEGAVRCSHFPVRVVPTQVVGGDLARAASLHGRAEAYRPSRGVTGPRCLNAGWRVLLTPDIARRFALAVLVHQPMST